MIVVVFKVLLKSVGDIIIKKLDNVHPIVLLFYRYPLYYKNLCIRVINN